MSDEEVIRRRLLIDGDGTGDDRRINVLFKSFIKWANSPDVDNTVHERILSQLAQCEFAQKKSRLVSTMSQEELQSYEQLSQQIEVEIEEAKKEIETTKIELQDAKQIRKNRIEYDVLAKVINQQPDRKETNMKLEALKQELGFLKEKSEQLEYKLEMRRKQFHVLLSSIHSLQAMLDESDEEIMNVSLENYEDAEMPSPKTAAYESSSIAYFYYQKHNKMSLKYTTEVPEGLKSFEIVTSDESVTSKILSITSVCRDCLSENNLSENNKKQTNNSVELVANDQSIPDFSEQYDDEVFDIFTNKQSIVCSRSTQTIESSCRKMSNILFMNELNHPATILNTSYIRRIITPNQHNQELILSKTQLCNIHRNYQKLKSRFHKLHADYQKLIGITGILTTSLQKSATGEPVNLHETLNTCMNIYPDIFHSNMHDCKATFMDQNTEMNFIQKSLHISMLNTVPISPKFLDYNKIKLHLLRGNVQTKLLLLQALRWKITLSQPEERDETVNEYIKNDLLGLHTQVSTECDNKSILPSLLISMDTFIPYTLPQSTARLLNTFASLKYGRDYLSMGPGVLNIIIQCLDNTRIKSIDAFTFDMIIATLQKLSLRRRQRLYMISAGLVEWLVYHLKAEYPIMGTYRLEYATALLMNLSLQKEAQIRAASMATILLSTLTMLLSSEHLPVLPYVNGALNNFLANSDINEEAKIIGLEAILEYYRQNRSGELRKHLDHILMRHRRKSNEMIDEDVRDDDDREELDILEDELDEMDPVKVEPGELFGEPLLTSCYSVALKVLPSDRFTHNSFSLPERGISPRLTPVNSNSKFENPIKLKLLSSGKKQHNSTSTNFDSLEDKTFVKLDSFPIRNFDNDTYSSVKKFHVTPDESHQLVTLNQDVEEKVNLYETIPATEAALFFSKNKELKNCQHHSSQSKNTSESPPLHYRYLDFDKKESSFIIESINTGSLSAEKVLEKFEIADNQKDEIAHSHTNGSNIAHEFIKEEEEVDAFASKPKISRTPPHSVSIS
ncbi:uncharacterized protein thoc7 [Chelonus insularis]|uniref:uncharacterized protein thoc7 n=1 Tax=Chelonus insularis TaxID=460826 RepID=UPI00158BB101|nr:uncharacterized protein LOC118068825 [Chelonus insularis]